MTTGLIIGKFYPPHIGHKYLIDFAKEFCDDLTVFCASMNSESIMGHLRFGALLKAYQHESDFVTIRWGNKTIPQDPSESPTFWEQWTDYIHASTGFGKYDYVFASEAYGKPLADVMGAKFIPCDIDRWATNGISGTQIRKYPHKFREYVLPEFFNLYYRKKVVIFGAESCGKTTVTKYAADYLNASQYRAAAIPEWARGYLDVHGEDVNREKFLEIINGQTAAMRAAENINCSVIIYDTDLIATRLWYDILMPDDLACIDDYLESKITQLRNLADLYLIMDTDIPFVPDPQRYGGDKRQATTGMCVDLCKRYGVKYKVISEPNKFDRQYRVVDEIRELLQQT